MGEDFLDILYGKYVPRTVRASTSRVQVHDPRARGEQALRTSQVRTHPRHKQQLKICFYANPNHNGGGGWKNIAMRRKNTAL